MAEDNAAYGPGHETYGKRQVSDQGSGDRVQAGKEQLIEDQPGCCPEDEEVVLLDGGAYCARQRYFAGGDLLTYALSAEFLHVPPLPIRSIPRSPGRSSYPRQFGHVVSFLHTSKIRNTSSWFSHL